MDQRLVNRKKTILSDDLQDWWTVHLKFSNEIQIAVNTE